MLIKSSPSIYTVDENDGFVRLRLVRRGNRSTESVVNVTPTSGSAIGVPFIVYTLHGIHILL